MKQGCLNVCMLGRLYIEYDGHPVQLPLDIHSITVQLLVLLWDAGEKGVSRDIILRCLYGEYEIRDPANSMRVNIFRLRKMLGKLPFPPHEYIVAEHGIYRWDGGDIGLETDVSCFKKNLKEAENASEAEEKKRHLEAACELYKGEFLPAFAAEHWAAVKNVDFQEMYIGAIGGLYDIYMKENEYEKAVTLADRAMKIYAYEPFAVMKIDALMIQGYFQKALDTLDAISRLLFTDLGVMPSDEMLKRYEAISSRIGNSYSSISKIKTCLNEEIVSGAYYCSFPSFVDCYRILSRLSIRNEQPVFLINCVMTDKQGRHLGHGTKRLNSAAAVMKAIESTLRAGDVYTKSNDNQFLILLSGLTVEDCSVVMDWISSCFHKIEGTRGVQLDFHITSAAPGKKI